jgi:hypothetical protein
MAIDRISVAFPLPDVRRSAARELGRRANDPLMSPTGDPDRQPDPSLPAFLPPGYPATALATGDFIGEQFSMDVPMADTAHTRG